MNRARLYAAAAALLAALVLARVLAPSSAPPTTLALPAADAPTDPSAAASGSLDTEAVAAPAGAATSAAPPGTASPGAPPGGAPGTASAAPPSARPARPARPADAPPDLPALRAALARLDAARTAAFADPPHADPGAWAAPSCACYAADAERLRALARDGTALRGHRMTIRSVALAAPATATRADLTVVDSLAAYTAVDRSGRVTGRWPATGERRWRVTLVLVSGRWLVGGVTRAP
jgi:hypothetical protein